MGESSGNRSYQSSLRSEQAAGTRRRILEAAAEAFARHGYEQTSLSEIARLAGVSVETVKLAGPKRQLLLSAFELAFAGDEGDQSLTERERPREVVALDDDAAFVGQTVVLIADANERTAGLWGAFVSAAQGDPAVASVYQSLLERRRRDFEGFVGMLRERGISTATTGDSDLSIALSFQFSPEGYRQLVQESGWTKERYEQWLVAAVTG